MMKVYQTVCPDIKFRLVADLSPDTAEVSEDSTLSSDSASCTSDEEDIKLRVYGESPASNPHPSHYSCSRLPPDSTSDAPFLATNTPEICHIPHFSSPVTLPVSAASQLLPTSVQPSALSKLPEENHTHVVSTDLMDGHPDLISKQSWNVPGSIADCTPPQESMVQKIMNAQAEEDTSTTKHNTNFSAADLPLSCAIQRPVCFYDKICDGINRYTEDAPPIDKTDSCMYDDDDNDSIEDISISHNVPMCPPSPAPSSPARSLGMGRRMVVTTGRQMGVASASSSHGKRSEPVRSSGLLLDVHTQTKFQSPYTLACAITPSPLHEHITMAGTLSTPTNCDSPAHTFSTSCNDPNVSEHAETPPSENLPDSPSKQEGEASPTSAMNRSIYDEIQEALIKEVSNEIIEDPPLTSDADPAQQYPFIHKHMGHLFDKKRLLIGYATSGPARHRDMGTSPCRSRNPSGRSRHVSAASSASEAATSLDENIYMNKLEDKSASDGEEEPGVTNNMDDEPDGAACAAIIYGQERRRKNSDGDGSRRHSSSVMSTPYSDLEVTHRGMHRFIPRHADEVQVGIGDPLHVIKEFDDLWCEGVNLRSGERGIFPAMYANDLTFLEESDEEDEHWKFTMRFLGTVEVNSASGDIALCQAINKVAQQGRIKTASLCTLEVNQYGIRMIDKSKEGQGADFMNRQHENHKFTNFFALKNISFCGTHPNNNRYFAFITKHPREMRFACHVFHSERSTHRARDALGKAFKRFYQEYMAFTHPTEDIWIE